MDEVEPEPPTGGVDVMLQRQKSNDGSGSTPRVQLEGNTPTAPPGVMKASVLWAETSLNLYLIDPFTAKA